VVLPTTAANPAHVCLVERRWLNFDNVDMGVVWCISVVVCYSVDKSTV
jgi:hypothetical protein